MKILQVLPELNAGGVERGTVDFARYLVAHGHESWVMSAGGRMLDQLLREGSRHIEFPVHRKSLLSYFKVPALRQKLLELQPDVIHVRSRMPAWMIWLALKNYPAKRPTLISTFHGLYSVSFYSAIMGCGDRVIAISECVKNYIVSNYPKIAADKICIVHRGVDTNQFNQEYQLADNWLKAFEQEFPNTVGKSLVVMPGRLSAWKGQGFFIEVIEKLLQHNDAVHGLIVGGADPKKADYEQSLKSEVQKRGLSEHISFAGHRSDMENIYSRAAVVVNLSQHAEPFGRTVIESLAMGTPVVAFNSGGPAESLRDCLPQGLVRENDLSATVMMIDEFIKRPPQFVLPQQFTLDYQAAATLKVYQQAISDKKE